VPPPALADPYPAFAQLDGSHPWSDAVPEARVLYPVRELESGTVTYFNFELAREMGLIPEKHPDELTRSLESTLLRTFALRIVNEYDQARGHRFARLKPRKYMATRYLQVQHPSRRGATSGDGRGIWNGTVTRNGITWDVSSRGTGVTCLAPGSVEAGGPLRTGGASHGYGCGLADIDELYAAAIMSAIFHRQGIPTERTLAIIDIGRKRGIGVRAHPNLIRPAHLFRLLKLNDYANLRRATDYFLHRQRINHAWEVPARGPHRYSVMCAQVARSFAELAARLDVDYIFVWMEWDGDNILADGSIIDYGSVRQFGMRHDQYRYDDVDRLSTTLNEQRLRARQILQTFVQMADYLRTGRKRSLGSFASHEEMALFDRVFEQSRKERLLQMIGLELEHARRLLQRHPGLGEAFEREFKYFERFKTSRPAGKVADGINRPAIFNLRDLLRELPGMLTEHGSLPVPSPLLFELMLSRSAAPEDRVMSGVQEERLQNLQVAYLAIVDALRGRRERGRFLDEIRARSAVINRADRITGNAVTEVVSRLMEKIEKGLPRTAIQQAIDHFVNLQVAPPAGDNALPAGARPHPQNRQLIRTLLKTVEELREDI
jgi:hypothetical protein